MIGKPINPLNAELNPICHLLALLGAHHILHVSGLRVNHRVSSIIIEFKSVYKYIINCCTHFFFFNLFIYFFYLNLAGQVI